MRNVYTGYMHTQKERREMIDLAKNYETKQLLNV
jgi:hypothetical protein